MSASTEREALAAEYVLGLLSGEDRIAAEDLAATDTTFAALVEDWRARLSVMDASARPQDVDPALWARIAGSLRHVAQDVPATATAGRRTQTMRPATSRPGLWSHLGFWRGAGLVGALASLVLAVGLAVQTQRALRTPVLVAVLVTDANEPAAVVNAFADGRTELVPLNAIAVPEGRALEIWTLWDRQVGPRSVGLIDRARSTRLKLQDLPLGPNQLFEITLEPAGGSPIGRPTGPILMKGLTSQAL